MKRFFRNNGLSIVMLALFLVFLAGQAGSGFLVYNEEQREHGEAELSLIRYLASGHFLESVFENWESEFLQMAAYVFLTAYLFQKGSAESKDPEGVNEVDEDPRNKQNDTNAPEPVRKGGWRLVLYEHSLSLALGGLFLVSFAGHAISGCKGFNEERTEHGLPEISLLQFLGSARFWFESFQNWQSEFLAVAAIVILSIWLRERGSPESKPVAMPHSETPG